jgi:hypothetical protein
MVGRDICGSSNALRGNNNAQRGNTFFRGGARTLGLYFVVPFPSLFLWNMAKIVRIVYKFHYYGRPLPGTTFQLF